MTPIKFPHQQFLEDNKQILTAHPLPEMLQKRILGFEDLQNDLPHTTEEDHSKLLSKLEKLSYELDEDLEEYFEAWLENNDQEDDEPTDGQQAEAGAARQEPPVPPVPSRQTNSVEPDTHIGLEEENERKENVSERSSPLYHPELSDEKIIEQVIKEQLKTIHPNELVKRGFKGLLASRKLLVGKFLLQRSRYETHYRITPLSK